MLMKLIYLDLAIIFFFSSLNGEMFTFCKRLNRKREKKLSSLATRQKVKLGHKIIGAVSRKDRLYSVPAGILPLNLDTMRATCDHLSRRKKATTTNRFLFWDNIKGNVCQPERPRATYLKSRAFLAFVISIQSE